MKFFTNWHKIIWGTPSHLVKYVFIWSAVPVGICTMSGSISRTRDRKLIRPSFQQRGSWYILPFTKEEADTSLHSFSKEEADTSFLSAKKADKSLHSAKRKLIHPYIQQRESWYFLPFSKEEADTSIQSTQRKLIHPSFQSKGSRQISFDIRSIVWRLWRTSGMSI